jgi:hypothetical protein
MLANREVEVRDLAVSVQHLDQDVIYFLFLHFALFLSGIMLP